MFCGLMGLEIIIESRSRIMRFFWIFLQGFFAPVVVKYASRHQEKLADLILINPPVRKFLRGWIHHLFEVIARIIYSCSFVDMLCQHLLFLIPFSFLYHQQLKLLLLHMFSWRRSTPSCLHLWLCSATFCWVKFSVRLVELVESAHVWKFS